MVNPRLRSLTLPARLLLAVAACTAVQAAPPNPPAEPVPLNPQGTVLLDLANKKLLLNGEVCLREGVLEMLVCLKRSKEHESIVAVDTKAQIVHAGLLALGAEPGKPVQYQPEFKPPTGQQIDIFFSWKDEEGQPHRVPAQTWVRNATRRYWIEKVNPPPAILEVPADSNLRWDAKRKELLWYGPMSDAERDQLLKLSANAAYQAAIKSFHKQTQVKQLDAPWVFAGSGFVKDQQTGDEFYRAEEGDLICVANFGTATIDLATPSTASNDELLYEAWTERIPPVGTPVTVELVPVEKKGPGNKE